MSMSNYLENEILDQIFGALAWSAPATVYVALSTTTPAEDGTNFTEPGGNYARVAVTNNKTSWSTATGGQIQNDVQISFPNPSSAWGTVTHVGVFDDPTAGNMLVYAALPGTGVSLDTQSGVPRFNIGDLKFLLD